MTPTEHATVTGLVKKATDLAQSLLAKNQALGARLATEQEAAAAADALVQARLLDPAEKEAAARTLADPKNALQTLVNVAQEFHAALAGTPGQPLAKAAADAGPRGAAADDTSLEFHAAEWHAELSKLAAQVPDLV